MANEKKIKHLEFLQLTITRMNVNSFLVKGWLITLVAAIFVLSQKDSNREFLYFIPLPAILFWIMDGFFITEERRYRSLYDDVRQIEEDKIDFSMNTKGFKKGKNHYLRGFASLTLLLFYPFVIITALVAAHYLNH